MVDVPRRYQYVTLRLKVLLLLDTPPPTIRSLWLLVRRRGGLLPKRVPPRAPRCQGVGAVLLVGRPSLKFYGRNLVTLVAIYRGPFPR